ncbi:MAG: hypothetical protein AB7P13_12010 [Candidatus Nitrosocosmicus sp.]
MNEIFNLHQLNSLWRACIKIKPPSNSNQTALKQQSNRPQTAIKPPSNSNQTALKQQSNRPQTASATN